MLLEEFYHSSDNLPMFIQSLCEDEDIIQVYHYHAFEDQVFKYAIHHSLESGQTICQAEEHDKRFIEASICPKGGFPFVFDFHPDIVKTPMDIKFGEVLCSLQLINKFGNEGEQVLALL